MQTPKILPPHYFLLSLLAMIGFTVLLGGGWLGSVWVYLGALPMAAGLCLAITASRQFSRAGTNIIPLTRSTALVTGGAFRLTRNPMYTGMVMFLAGLALLLDNPWNWLVVLIFTGIIRQRFVVKEEALMTQTFGDDYLSYCAAVRRWI